MRLLAGSILTANAKGPWDNSPSGEDGSKGGSKPEKSPNPWDQTPDISPKGGRRGRGPSLEELLRRTGGGGGGGASRFPGGMSGGRSPMIFVGAALLLWLIWTSVHRLGPEQEGVVTLFGKYSYTVGPGISFTLPSPIQGLQKIDTKQIRTTTIGSPQASTENLVLTKDQNIIDMAYEVRWSINNPELYLFQLENPETTVQEVAESAMRATVANFDLVAAIGPGRSDIEAQVRQRMQEILDQYRAGVRIQGIAIRQSDPPAEVNEAFRKVNAAQQQRESNLNDARAIARQITERALGETAEFDKLYVQYREAPGVTKRRLYYQTMEEILAKTDKTIIESGGVTPYLPLPELKRRAAPQDVVVQGERK